MLTKKFRTLASNRQRKVGLRASLKHLGERLKVSCERVELIQKSELCVSL